MEYISSPELIYFGYNPQLAIELKPTWRLGAYIKGLFLMYSPGGRY